jgi:hypothetical protein
LSQSRADLMQAVNDFERVIGIALGGEAAPPALAVDLSDLLGTLEKGSALLRSLAAASDPTEIAERMSGVEMLLAEEIAMIANDVLPALRSVKERAYAALEEEDPANGASTASPSPPSR